jgi:uncharacterized protein YndB with AHSA1/START domain
MFSCRQIETGNGPCGGLTVAAWEGRSMSDERFVYVTYIRATPEKLWDALIRPEFTRQYWCGTWQDCEWKVGSSWRLMIPDGRVGDSGEVVEIERP